MFISESIVGKLGTQRIIPSPQRAVVGEGGLTYTFPASSLPAAVEFVLQPSDPGIYDFNVNVVGADAIRARVVVVP